MRAMTDVTSYKQYSIGHIKYELLIGCDVSHGTHLVPKISQAFSLLTSVGVKGQTKNLSRKERERPGNEAMDVHVRVRGRSAMHVDCGCCGSESVIAGFTAECLHRILTYDNI